jgi:aspartokinase-like uncharacterized kinase
VNDLAVVKVGGSLLDWPPLPTRLSSYLGERSCERLLLIVGGGRMADAVRGLDTAHGLGDERSHWLALRALDLTAHCLAAIVSGVAVVDDPGGCHRAWDAGHVPVLAPRRFLEADDRTAAEPLEHSWVVTSDSIAARVAQRWGASELVLLKSAKLPAHTDRDEAARLGLVDRAFPGVSRRLVRVTYVDFRTPGSTASPLPRRLDSVDVRAGQSGGSIAEPQPTQPQVLNDGPARARPPGSS